MRRAFVVLSVLIAVVLAGLAGTASPACACSCAPITPAQALAEADVVFIGTAVQRTGPADPFSPEDATYLFAVEQVIKGPSVDEPGIRVGTANDSASCGIGFTIGDRYKVFANGTATELRATACGGTRRLGRDTPAPDGSGDVPITAAEKTQIRPGGVMAAALVGGGVLLLRSRRRRRA